MPQNFYFVPYFKQPLNVHRNQNYQSTLFYETPLAVLNKSYTRFGRIGP
jgi:hypothetical protein